MSYLSIVLEELVKFFRGILFGVPAVCVSTDMAGVMPDLPLPSQINADTNYSIHEVMAKLN